MEVVVEADVDDAARLFDAGVAPGAEQRSLAAEGTGAEAERGYLQARGAELAVFHRRADAAHAPASCCIAISMLIRPPPTDQSEKSFSPRYTNTSCGRMPAACPRLPAIRAYRSRFIASLRPRRSVICHIPRLSERY